MTVGWRGWAALTIAVGAAWLAAGRERLPDAAPAPRDSREFRNGASPLPEPATARSAERRHESAMPQQRIPGAWTPFGPAAMKHRAGDSPTGSATRLPAAEGDSTAAPDASAVSSPTAPPADAAPGDPSVVFRLEHPTGVYTVVEEPALGARRPAELRVIVATPDGRPVEGAVLRVAGESFDRTVTTGADGKAACAIGSLGVVNIALLSEPETVLDGRWDALNACCASPNLRAPRIHADADLRCSIVLDPARSLELRLPGACDIDTTLGTFAVSRVADGGRRRISILERRASAASVELLRLPRAPMIVAVYADRERLGLAQVGPDDLTVALRDAGGARTEIDVAIDSLMRCDEGARVFAIALGGDPFPPRLPSVGRWRELPQGGSVGIGLAVPHRGRYLVITTRSAGAGRVACVVDTDRREPVSQRGDAFAADAATMTAVHVQWSLPYRGYAGGALGAFVVIGQKNAESGAFEEWSPAVPMHSTVRLPPGEHPCLLILPFGEAFADGQNFRLDRIVVQPGPAQTVDFDR